MLFGELMQIVVCAIARNEHLYINEWVGHYLKLGFNKIYIFDNDKLDSPYLKDYIEPKYLNKVEIIDMRGVEKKYFQQWCYQEFYDKYAFDWCLYCDIDEFLVGINNIHSWLELPYLRKTNQIRIKWRLFGDNGLIERDMSKGVMQTFTKTVNSSLNRALNKKGTLETQGKAIVRGGLPNVVICSPHFASYKKRDNVIPSILPSGKPCWSKVEIKEDYRYENIYINHYMTKSLSEFVNQKLNRNDAVFNTSIALDYYWRINEKTPEKLEWLKEKGLIQ